MAALEFLPFDSESILKEQSDILVNGLICLLAESLMRRSTPLSFLYNKH